LKTFGQIITEERKKLGVSQKELAAQIKKENGEPISPQYLNDLERDRRNAPSEFLIEQFARELSLDKDYLLFVAGSLPEDIRQIGIEKPETVHKAYSFFRRAKKPS
jgi:transcriptional regulator with XRE-family HTH domain